MKKFLLMITLVAASFFSAAYALNVVSAKDVPATSVHGAQVQSSVAKLYPTDIIVWNDTYEPLDISFPEFLQIVPELRIFPGGGYHFYLTTYSFGIRVRAFDLYGYCLYDRIVPPQSDVHITSYYGNKMKKK